MKFEKKLPILTYSKPVFIVIGFILLLLFYVLFSCKQKNTGVVNVTVPTKQVVVVDKIAISGGKYQKFIVSGKNFEFSTSELTFNVNDTIVIEGDTVFPKSNPNNKIQL